MMPRYKLFFLLSVLLVQPDNTMAQDSANYLNKAWRDSVAHYRGRVEAYHQELYSYDWGMTFGMLPVVGEGIYLGKWSTGIEYSAARAVSIAIAAIGAIRLIGGKADIGLNIVMLVGGIAGYIGLKLSELADMRHTVSERNEALVEKFGIKTPDIVPNSIRYPEKQWPDWVTSWPPERHPQQSKEAVEKPLPKAITRGATGNY